MSVRRLLFAKVEAWLLLLFLLLAFIGAVFFGFLVLDGTKDEPRFTFAAKAAVTIANVPDTIGKIIEPPDRLRIWNSDRFKSKLTGWSSPSQAMPTLDGYLLLSYYDGTERRHRLEFISMRDWTTVYNWNIDGGELLQDAATTSEHIDFSTWNASLFRSIHPLLLPEGDLIIKDHYSPLMRLDACANRIWLKDDRAYHHSTEVDAEGNLWVPSLVEPHQIVGVADKFVEDEIVKMSPDGEILFDRSVAKLLLDHGLNYLMFTNGAYVDDPTHLNDIEPIDADGPYWKSGDVLLSLRNISRIMLYRPSTDDIVWWKQGPWMAQHDVDVLDDHRISVYDNHAEDRGRGASVFDHSDIVIYDFATDAISRPLAGIMQSENIQTLFAGLYSELPKNYALIEDVTNGRLIVVGPDGALAAEYINRADNGFIYHLGWSRYIGQAAGDEILAKLNGARCGDL